MKHLKKFNEGAYMYPIIIKKEPQMVSYHNEFELSDLWLSLNDLKEYVGDNDTFFIDSEENKIYVSGNRLENKEEVDKRVLREESYMRNYTEFHKNKGKI